MPQLVLDALAGDDWICSRNGSSLYTAYNGTGTLGYNSNFGSASYLPVGAQGKNVNGSYWKVLQGECNLNITSIPTDAVITSVTARYYVVQDVTDTNFRLELYYYDWGSSYSTTDWQNPAELTALYNADKRLAYDDTSGVSVGWNNLVMSQNFIDWLNTRRGLETYFMMLWASDDNRLQTSINTNHDLWLDIADVASLTPEFTINYFIPSAHTINLGTHF